MKWDLKALLKNKMVLYVVLFLAVTNLFGYLMTRNFDAVILMLVVGIVVSNFTKNMIIILGVTVLATGFAASNKLIGSVIEGMEDDIDDDEEEVVDKTKNKKKEGHTRLRPKKVSQKTEKNSDEEEDEVVVGADETEQKGATGGKQSNIDYASTLEKAYDNLDTLLNSDAINKMSDETERLGQKQKQLMKNIDKLEPMMQKAGGMLEKFDVDGMMGKMEKMMGGLSKLKGV